MEKRTAVERKPGNTVADSGRVLRRPIRPPTADRKPAASPPSPPQLKSRQKGAGEARAKDSARREARALPPDLDVCDLRSFFELLDRWDRGIHATKTM